MKEVIDLVDARLVEALQRNARLSLKELAKAAGVSVPTVRQRLRRLERLGIIRKYTVATVASRLEGRHRALVLLRLEPGAQEEGAAKLAALQEVREVHRLLGTYDLAARVEVDEISKVPKLLGGLRGVIEACVTLIYASPKEEYGSLIEPNTFVQFRCEFCHKPIYGKPLAHIVEGIRYHFSSAECLEAYLRQRTTKGSAK